MVVAVIIWQSNERSYNAQYLAILRKFFRLSHLDTFFWVDAALGREVLAGGFIFRVRLNFILLLPPVIRQDP